MAVIDRRLLSRWTVVSSDVWCRVVWLKFADVSKKRAAFKFRTLSLVWIFREDVPPKCRQTSTRVPENTFQNTPITKSHGHENLSSLVTGWLPNIMQCSHIPNNRSALFLSQLRTNPTGGYGKHTWRQQPGERTCSPAQYRMTIRSWCTKLDSASSGQWQAFELHHFLRLANKNHEINWIHGKQYLNFYWSTVSVAR